MCTDFKNKSSSSIFINFGSFLSYLGTADEGMTAYGLNISPGYCILQNNKTFSLNNKNQETNLKDALKSTCRKFTKEKTGKKPITNINLVRI